MSFDNSLVVSVPVGNNVNSFFTHDRLERVDFRFKKTPLKRARKVPYPYLFSFFFFKFDSQNTEAIMPTHVK